ncbi:PepSY-associated TM helix domain-containing protein [Neobacillus drentensis]|uniref:PepSY-associated TM helix domain-containing protein n=1 Tax=Neobacillus drentensis TaxID=220684 RepID=UPI003000238E
MYMRKTRKAHLWIGLICSIFILIESVTGLLMNEPWLIGQTQMEGNRGNFQPGQFNPGQMQQGAGTTTDPSQAQGQAQGQTQGGQTQGQTGANANTNANANGQTGFNGNGQFQGRNGMRGPGGEGGTGSITGIIKGLHAGRIGTTDVKWLVDLVAIAMIFLTISGIYLSLKVLNADKKRKNRKADGQVA